jgi:PAS domain S-box-containing protein
MSRRGPMAVKQPVTVKLESFQHRPKEELKGRERWLDIALEHTAEAVIAVDRANTIRFMNTAAERLTGWSREAAVGRVSNRIVRAVDAETRREIEDPMSRISPGEKATERIDDVGGSWFSGISAIAGRP